MLALWKRKTDEAMAPASDPFGAIVPADAASGVADPMPTHAAINAPLIETRPVAPARERIPWHLRTGAPPRAARTAGITPALAIAAIAACLAITVGLRKTVVATVPETASLFAAVGMPVNLRGLELRDIKSGIFSESSVELLVVQGEIANVTNKPKDVPPLLFTVRDAKGATVYSWSASADVRTLEPGAKAAFRRRLASPPPEGMEVLVRFAGKPEQVAAAH